VFTYQVRKRIFRLTDGREPSLPNTFEAVFTLQPLQPFGMTAGGGKTAVQSVGAAVYFNANTGHHFVESKQALRPLEVVVEEPVRKVELRGNVFRIEGRVESLGELEETLLSVCFGLPILLNVEFADPPVVERVDGKVGDVSFRWELTDWRIQLLITTQDEQEKKTCDSWCRFDVLAKPGNRRLIAALHYFHVFCRLCRAGNTPWEFMGEALVNLSKILEVLFPPTGDGQTMEASRTGLTGLGYSTEEIDRDFIPAMVLRSNIDSAHVDLSVFTRTQLQVLHAYTEAAEMAFRKLLSKILTEAEAGRYQVMQHTACGHESRTAKIIERLAKHFGDSDHQPQ
jgi:hypothetical protein